MAGILNLLVPGHFPALRRIQIRLPKKSVIKIAQKKEQNKALLLPV